MDHCPKCNQTLNIDEKASGRCFTCGETFSSPIPQDHSITDSSLPFPLTNEEPVTNGIALWLRIISAIILVIGVIISIKDGMDSDSFWLFLTSLFPYIIASAILDGFAEIIILLEKINNKLKT